MLPEALHVDCNQATIPDAAFVHLRGIQDLIMND